VRVFVFGTTSSPNLETAVANFSVVGSQCTNEGGNLESQSSRWLWTRLILPLGFSDILCGLLAIRWPLRGLWIGLGTTLAGIIITVLYVERVLTRQRESEWRLAASLISERIVYFTHGSITRIRTALGIDVRSLGLRGEDLSQKGRYLEISKQAIEPQIPTRAMILDSVGWAKVFKAIAASHSEVERILLTFGSRLGPDEYGELLGLQNDASLLLNYEQIFPESFQTRDSDARRYDNRTSIDRRGVRNRACILLRDFVCRLRRLGERVLPLSVD